MEEKNRGLELRLAANEKAELTLERGQANRTKRLLLKNGALRADLQQAQEAERQERERAALTSRGLDERYEQFVHLSKRMEELERQNAALSSDLHSLLTGEEGPERAAVQKEAALRREEREVVAGAGEAFEDARNAVAQHRAPARPGPRGGSAAPQQGGCGA